jgi:Icc-related predicted phosphoesterase
MRILVLADKESPALWDYFEKRKLEGIDLILSCGDLEPDYLSFLATFTHAPVLYVHGNHDRKYEKKPPEGCICIEDDIFVYKGIRIMGLGGSHRYSSGAHQYTQTEMVFRFMKMWFRLKTEKGVDILLTHSPAFEINDNRDLPHVGFKIFNYILKEYRPKYFIHGHVHLNYNRKQKRRDRYEDTEIINGFEKYVFEYETGEEVLTNF